MLKNLKCPWIYPFRFNQEQAKQYLIQLPDDEFFKEAQNPLFQYNYKSLIDDKLKFLLRQHPSKITQRQLTHIHQYFHTQRKEDFHALDNYSYSILKLLDYEKKNKWNNKARINSLLLLLQLGRTPVQIEFLQQFMTENFIIREYLKHYCSKLRKPKFNDHLNMQIA
ncbi:hypothetical protein pb186bvf_014365 [Paramecium bursaria]